jgi:hypothetical protein
METIRVVKNGKSIRNCIEIPDSYLEKELEITIRPIPEKKDYGRSITALFLKYPDARPFEEISDPGRWEREIRSEW